MDDDTTRFWSQTAASLRAHGPRRMKDSELEDVHTAPTLVGLPDGRGSHLVHVLDRQWLTQRVRAATTGRDELWVTSALGPLVTVLVEDDVPLATGGQLRDATFGRQAIVGPPGWLPDMPAGGLVGIRLVDGVAEVATVAPPTQTLRQQQELREVLARHVHDARWWGDPDELNTRFTITRAVAAAVLEVPGLLCEPWPPLDEILADPLHEQHRHSWRDLSAWQLEGNVSFSVEGMPEGLHGELGRRAAAYGMSFDQYVIAVLGHLAWRTPFAEDLEPWEDWKPEAGPEAAEPRRLRILS